MVSKLIKIVLGVLLIVLGIWTIVYWWPNVLVLVKGSLGFALVLAGLICFAILD